MRIRDAELDRIQGARGASAAWRGGRSAGGTAMALALLISTLTSATTIARSQSTTESAALRSASPGRFLAQRLERAGRAEARFEREAPDPLSGSRSRIDGRLAIELPNRFSLEVPSTGERIMTTSEGGAWIRPELRQLIRLGPEQAAAMRRAWQMLLGEAGEVRVEPLGPRRYAVALADSSLEPLRIEVTLDAAQLPARVDYEENGSKFTYRFRSWRFVPKRGARAFTLATPAGYDTLRLP